MGRVLEPTFWESLTGSSQPASWIAPVNRTSALMISESRGRRTFMVSSVPSSSKTMVFFRLPSKSMYWYPMEP